MSKPKSIHDYMPEQHEEETTFIQARVPKSLAGEMKRQLKKEGRTWVQFLIAACRKYLAEKGASQ